MENLPTRTSADGNAFTVSDFFKAGRESLSLSLVCGGENLNRRIEEPIVNRPGLALTGFYDHFAWERLQLIGNAERSYLDSLPESVRLERLRALSDRKAFIFVFTNGLKPTQAEVSLAEENRNIALTVSGLAGDIAAMEDAGVTGTIDLGKWMEENDIDSLTEGSYVVPVNVVEGKGVDVMSNVTVELLVEKDI